MRYVLSCVFVFLLVGSASAQNFNLEIFRPNGQYTHRGGIVRCAGTCFEAGSGAPHPQAVAIGVLAGVKVTLNINGRDKVETVYDGGGTLGGEATAGAFSGMVKPNTKWQMGAHKLEPVSLNITNVNPANNQGGGSFHVVASDEEELEDILNDGDTFGQIIGGFLGGLF